jgi:membrane protease YdiL (CAAX protease family)
MRQVPLIPDGDTFGAAIVVVLSLSSFSLASHIHSRWLRRRHVPFLTSYACILVLVAVGGALIQDPRRWFGGGVSGWMVSVLLGIPIWQIATRCDRYIVRALERRSALGRRRLAGTSHAFGEPWSAIRAAQPIEDRSRSPRRADPSRALRDRPTGLALLEHQPSAWGLVVVGCLEELPYRAILVQSCLALGGGAATGLALAGTVVAFGLSHVEFGWSHVVSKTCFGGLALVGALVTGNAACALVAHALFNLTVAREQQRSHIARDREQVAAWSSL